MCTNSNMIMETFIYHGHISLQSRFCSTCKSELNGSVCANCSNSVGKFTLISNCKFEIKDNEASSENKDKDKV